MFQNSALMIYTGSDIQATKKDATKKWANVNLCLAANGKALPQIAVFDQDLIKSIEEVKPFTPVNCTISLEANGRDTRVNLLQMLPIKSK